jgi:hypothetical protein
MRDPLAAARASDTAGPIPHLHRTETLARACLEIRTLRKLQLAEEPCHAGTDLGSSSLPCAMGWPGLPPHGADEITCTSARCRMACLRSECPQLPPVGRAFHFRPAIVWPGASDYILSEV